MKATTNQPIIEYPSSTLSNRTIIRSQHDRDNPYFLMRRAAAQDDRLSWEARGLLAYVLSKADNWKVRLGDLRRQGATGRDAARRILKELEITGYLTRERVRIAHAQFNWVCTVYEQPQTAKNARKSPYPKIRRRLSRRWPNRRWLSRRRTTRPYTKQRREIDEGAGQSEERQQ